MFLSVCLSLCASMYVCVVTKETSSSSKRCSLSPRYFLFISVIISYDLAFCSYHLLHGCTVSCRRCVSPAASATRLRLPLLSLYSFATPSVNQFFFPIRTSTMALVLKVRLDCARECLFRLLISKSTV